MTKEINMNKFIGKKVIDNYYGEVFIVTGVYSQANGKLDIENEKYSIEGVHYEDLRFLNNKCLK